MNPIQTIRARLGVTQSALAKALGVSQGNVSHYEQGQAMPATTAKLLIEFAAVRGHVATYNDIYGAPDDLRTDVGTPVVQAAAPRRATDPAPPPAPERPFRKPISRKGIMECAVEPGVDTPIVRAPA